MALAAYPELVRRGVAFALLLGTLAARAESEDRATMAEADLRLISVAEVHWLRVWVARTEEQRRQGLMERTSLDENSGMLFVYEQLQSTDAGFWMYRTPLPLDIAFLDQHRTIVAIRTMTPCAGSDPQRCAAYRSSVPYLFALEVNGGYFARHGLRAGDRVEFVVPAAETPDEPR